MEKKPKVMFTFVEAGMGHIIPMTGMADAFEKKYGDRCEIVRSRIFSESESPAVRKMGEEQIRHTKLLSVNLPYRKFEAFSYHLPSRIVHGFLDLHFKKAIRDCSAELRNAAPDLLVASYFLPAHVAAIANKKELTDTLIATYSPDPYIYPAWDRQCDLFLVNNDAAAKMARKKKFRNIVQVPFLYKSGLTEIPCEDKAAARAAIGLPERFTLLFANGAYGTKKTGKILEKIIAADFPINFVVICGKDEKRLQSVLALRDRVRRMNLLPMGFTDRIGEYMAASDLAIGKCGSNTMMESVALKCPLLVNAEANRLEEITARYGVKNGLVLRETNHKKILKRIEEAIEHPDALRAFSKGFDPYRIPNGGEVCADLLFELLKKKFPELR